MIKAIALDDEPLALEVVRNYCQRIEFLDLLRTFTEQEKAIRYLNKFDVDVIFLDIQMPGLNGMMLYKSLRQGTRVIFTTAHSHYAVEGFNVSASDYLLKPFSMERFLVAVRKVQQELFLEHSKPPADSHLVIRADFKLHRIPHASIILIEALDDYIQIHLENGKKIVARSTMKAILGKLPGDKFKRAHRSYIVAIKKISSVSKDTARIEGFTVPLSNTFKAEILKNL